ncbi:unnamed protein product [Arctia plantaginis]|uniref:Uncharacterized protein n=1 Tax=Arctia plantaginis TaxID=874455 RepID=A0A8S1BH13_ARCPL|nr:unnamed protein product [Arctia plantaginis]
MENNKSLGYTVGVSVRLWPQQAGKPVSAVTLEQNLLKYGTGGAEERGDSEGWALRLEIRPPFFIPLLCEAPVGCLAVSSSQREKVLTYLTTGGFLLPPSASKMFARVRFSVS